MTEQEARLKRMLETNPSGATAAANLDDILKQVQTPDTARALNQLAGSPYAEKAREGDAQAMTALMRELMANADGQALIAKVKRAAEQK